MTCDRTTSRAEAPVKADDYPVRRVIVKFREDVKLAHDFDAAEALEKMGHGFWSELRKIYPGVKLEPIFLRLRPDDLAALEKEVRANDPEYRCTLLSYFAVRVPNGVAPKDVASVIKAWPIVSDAYVESGRSTPPSTAFLTGAPTGIDANAAWAEGPGGQGQGINLIDIEQGWNYLDPALPATVRNGPVFGCSKVFHAHGTAVVSIIAGHTSVQGIAPKASVHLVSRFHADWDPVAQDYVSGPCDIASTLDALQAATRFLQVNGQAGDIILIESQTEDEFLPEEVDPAVFQLIWMLTQAGFVVIEAAGNAGVTGVAGPRGEPALQGLDIDGYLPQASGTYMDSGAIIVGAAQAASGHTCMSFTNFGTRVDCYAWGEGITAAGAGLNHNFGGTSGAAAIVAGLALCVQGIAQQQHNRRYKPAELRDILSTNGTQSTGTQPIGRMPDLAVIVPFVKNNPPK